MKTLYINTIKYTLHKEFKSLSNSKSYCATRNLSGIEQKVFLKRLELSQVNKNLYKTLLELHNQNIAKIFEIGENGDFFYVVQEWIEGLTLLEVWSFLLKDTNFINKKTETLLLGWIYEISLALETLQSAQPPLAHNDLAPHNIMIRKQDCSAILIDFDHASTIGSYANPLKNPLFSPPLGSLHKNILTFQSDIYSLAKLVSTLMESKISEDLTKLVTLCTQDVDTKGPKTALEFRKLLEVFLSEASGETLSRPELMRVRGAVLEKAWHIPEGAVQQNKGDWKEWHKVLWSSLVAIVSCLGFIGYVRPLGSREAVPISAVVVPWGITGVKDVSGKWIESPVSGRHFIWHLSPGLFVVETSHPVLGLKVLKILVIPENPQVFTLDFNKRHYGR